MAMNNIDKNLLIASMERSVNDAKEAAGIATLSELETAVSALRTAYDADPATVLAADIVAAQTILNTLVFPIPSNLNAVFTEAAADAAA